MIDVLETAKSETGTFDRSSIITSQNLIKEVERLRQVIEEAKNCLVCCSIGDPMEVCVNTLNIL